MPRATKRIPLFLSCLLLLIGCRANAVNGGTLDDAGHTKVGDTVPAFSVQEISGDTFSIGAERGKVVVVSFWATWCGPCQVEMPLLEKDIWEKYKSSADFAMVGIAREQTKETVSNFQAHHSFTYPLAYDPDRSTYRLFADSGIPRTYVVDRRGRIVYQSVGYGPGVVDELDKAVRKALSE